ncbi:MAG TPA: MOSC domain-containing protein, partial [Chitinophagaceae bacterium]|nr:MOSC domain-containing protein [Chitinophagaceae bacterium]
MTNEVILGMVSISQLYIYPIKSLGGIAVTSAAITDRGLQNDRRFMLVDDNNLFLTQREHRTMALLRTAIEDNDLIVYHKDNPEEKLKLPLVPEVSASAVMVKVWDDWCEGQYISEEADKWFSEKL